jgi:hypothetical protein
VFAGSVTENCIQYSNKLLISIMQLTVVLQTGLNAVVPLAPILLCAHC